MSYIKGIDVSEWQNVIEWDKVKGQVDFVMLRAGYGQNNIDKQFIRNISECNKLNIPCGVYWFSYALTAEMAKKEAQYCLNAIKDYRVEYPICFDFEYDSVNYMKKKGVDPSKNLCTDIVVAFISAIEAAGYYAMNYTNNNFTSMYYNADKLAGYDYWCASWYKTPNFEKPPVKCGIWQYWNQGAIDGIVGNVDMNISYKDYPAIIKAAGLNNLEQTETTETAEEQAAQKLITAGYGDILIALAEKI